MERRHRQPGVPGGSSNQGDTAFYCSRNSTICVSRKKYGYDADDYESFLGTPLGDREHGTRETLIHWIDRVFYMTTLQGCNTRGCPPGSGLKDATPEGSCSAGQEVATPFLSARHPRKKTDERWQ